MEEVKQLCEGTKADLVIFDNDLSPSQQRVLTETLGVQVLDRSPLFWIFLPSGPERRKGGFRWSWPSTNTCCPG